MALTLSTMMPLGTLAPDFHLMDVRTKQYHTLDELKSEKATVIAFICNHCPYVIHIQQQLVEMARTYQAKGIHFIAISSNDVETYPQDGPEAMKAEALANHYEFPYLYDATQAVAIAYQAACTPDFYIFDQDLHCVYRGQFDDSTPGNGIASTGNDLRAALDAILIGQPVAQNQLPSRGCNIKWRKLS